jgi:hypothetical protein
MSNSRSSPAFAGEGDRAEGVVEGRRVSGGCTAAPSTVLRTVPLPTKSWGGFR